MGSCSGPPMATRQQATATFKVTFPNGIAYRNSPNYNDRITTTRGPTNGSVLTGSVVQSDVQYLQIQNSNGGFVYVPLYATNGQQLMQPVQQQTTVVAPMQRNMQQDLSRVNNGYGSNNRNNRSRYGNRSRGGCGGYSSSDDCNEGYGGRRGGGYGGGRSYGSRGGG